MLNKKQFVMANLAGRWREYQRAEVLSAAASQQLTYGQVSKGLSTLSSV
jgi:hypothetical protein